MSNGFEDSARRLRVLVLARAFPNAALPSQGLWVERFVQAARSFARVAVVSPIAWSPPFTPVSEWRALRRVPVRGEVAGVPVAYPRVAGGLFHTTHAWDAAMALPTLRRVTARLHAQEPFSLVHAHFIYPDGVVASALGRELGIPVVTTEHANWRPWLDEAPKVRAQVLDALTGIRVVTAVSESTRRSIVEVAGNAVRTELLPNALDEASFVPPGDAPRVPGRVLFVGMVRHVKGLDVLVRALASLRRQVPEAHLRVVGSTLSVSNRRDYEAVRHLVAALGLVKHVDFVGLMAPAQVAKEMSTSCVLAVPSRRESFSAVTIEALASGTPVVATRCGGPEELLDDTVGRLVPVEDPEAMASALRDVMRSAAAFDPMRLRARVLPMYGAEATSARLRRIYDSAMT